MYLIQNYKNYTIKTEQVKTGKYETTVLRNGSDVEAAVYEASNDVDALRNQIHAMSWTKDMLTIGELVEIA